MEPDRLQYDTAPLLSAAPTLRGKVRNTVLRIDTLVWTLDTPFQCARSVRKQFSETPVLSGTWPSVFRPRVSVFCFVLQDSHRANVRQPNRLRFGELMLATAADWKCPTIRSRDLGVIQAEAQCVAGWRATGHFFWLRAPRPTATAEVDVDLILLLSPYKGL